MKLRLFAMSLLLLLMNILLCCNNQAKIQNEPTLVTSRSLCKLDIDHPVITVEYVSVQCKKLTLSSINWERHEHYREGFLNEYKVTPPYVQALENNGTNDPPLPQPSKDIDEQQYAGVAYLTFDDGPGKFTEEVLDILAENEIAATFFVLGQLVERHTETMRRIAAEGHSIGNHTYNHVYDELYNDFNSFSDQVLQTSQAIFDATGQLTPLLRAPGGTHRNIDTTYYDAMSEAGYIMFDWNVDSGDSTGRNISAETIVNNIKEAKLMERVIVLMHDSNSHEATIAALPEIITYYREQNYRFDVITTETDPILSRITDNIRWKRTPVTKQEKKAFKDKVNEFMNQ